jgi:LCP family protein required for cell wall assembly
VQEVQGRDPDDRDRDRTGRRHRTWGQRLAIAFGCLATLGLLVSATGLGYLLRKYERLQRVELGDVLDETTSSDEPENFLLVGIDDASDLPGDDSVRVGRDPTDKRSDTIMILRTDPATGRAALLSLPRDLYVDLADGGQGRINLAFRRGGARQLIRTIDQNFGIKINHYVQVDFASFRGLVDAIGGVPVPVQRPARDSETGLEVLEAGCHTLGPVQALAYVRSRHYEELIDGEWEEDLRSDFGRIDRQQDFIRRALSRAIDRGARNPGTLNQLIDVALDGVAVDRRLTADDIADLGARFRSFDPESLVTYSLDGTPDVVGGAEILRLVDGPETEEILDIFRGGGGDELEPESVRVTVHNGTGAPRQGTLAAEELAEVGFVASVSADELGAGAAGTIVRHPPGQEDEADLVARWLVGGATLEEVDGSSGIEVVTGSDWQGVRDEAQPSTSSTTVDTLPEATTSTTGSDSSSSSPGDAGSTSASDATTTTTAEQARVTC